MKISQICEGVIRLVKHRKSVRRAPAKLTFKSAHWSMFGQLGESCLARPKDIDDVRVRYVKRLTRNSVLCMRRHRNGGIVDGSIEGRDELALRAEQRSSTRTPTIMV